MEPKQQPYEQINIQREKLQDLLQDSILQQLVWTKISYDFFVKKWTLQFEISIMAFRHITESSIYTKIIDVL